MQIRFWIKRKYRTQSQKYSVNDAHTSLYAKKNNFPLSTTTTDKTVPTKLFKKEGVWDLV